jgi:WD40 repeat protein
MRYFYVLMIFWIGALSVFADEPITPQNADQIVQLQMIGQGISYDLAYSPDGRTVALASSTGIWVYDADDLTNPLFVLPSSTYPIYQVAYNSDSTRLLGLQSDYSNVVWDIETGSLLMRLQNDRYHYPHDLGNQFSPDNRLVLSIYARQIHIFDAETGDPVRVLEMAGYTPIKSVFSPNSAQVLTAYDDGLIVIWDIESGTVIHRLRSDYGSVFSVTYSPDGQKFSIASDGVSQIWDVGTGDLLHDLKGYEGWVSSFRYRSDGAKFLSVTSEGLVILWDATTGEQDWAIPLSPNIGDLIFSPDESQILAVKRGYSLELLDAQTGDLVRSIVHGKRANQAVFSPDGGRIIASSHGYKGLLVWDVETGELLQDGEQAGAAILPDSAQISDRALSPSQTLLDAFPSSQSAALMAGGEWLMTLDFYDDLSVWDIATGESVFAVGDVSASAVSPDGRFLAYEVDQTLSLWDSETGTHSHFDLADLQPPINLETLIFSPDGQMLVGVNARGYSIGQYSTLEVWDVATGTHHNTLTGHTERITTVTFSADQSQILTASNDGTVRIWGIPE